MLEQCRAGELVERREGRGAGDRVSAERRAVGAGRQHRRDPGGRARGADREPAAECLREGHDVRRHADVLVREKPARAAHAALHLVEDEKELVPVGQVAEARQVVGRRHVDAALALDRLDEDRDRLVAHGRRHRRRVVVGDEANAGQERLEALVVLLLAGGGERGERAAVEGACGRQDLVPAAVLAAPAAGELHRRLVRLGAAVAEKDALGERVPAEERRQFHRRRGVVDVRGMEQGRGLGANRFDDRRMAVAQIVDREAGEEVEIALAVGVPELGPAPPDEGDGLTGIDPDLVRRARRENLRVRHRYPSLTLTRVTDDGAPGASPARAPYRRRGSSAPRAGARGARGRRSRAPA